MSDFPTTLVYFEAFTTRERDDAFGKAGDLRPAFGGVIEPQRTPISQAAYERECVKPTIENYRQIPSVVLIETRRFKFDGRVRRTFTRKATT